MRKHSIVVLALVLMIFASINVIASANNVTNENITTSMDVDDAPLFLSLTISDGVSSPGEIDLMPETTNQINCSAVIMDFDGQASILWAKSRLFLNSVGFAAADDNQNHYTNDTCAIDAAYGNANEVLATCSFDVYFYADAGLWNCSINTTDGSSVSSEHNTTTLLSLLAVDVEDGNMDFGTLTIGGDTGTDDISKDVTNIGNTNFTLKLNVWGTALNDNRSMSCTTGYSVPSDIRVALSAGVAYASRIQLNSTAGDGEAIGLNITKQTAGVVGVTETIYFGMGVSATGSPTGTCTGNVMFTASEV